MYIYNMYLYMYKGFYLQEQIMTLITVILLLIAWFNLNYAKHATGFFRLGKLVSSNRNASNLKNELNIEKLNI